MSHGTDADRTVGFGPGAVDLDNARTVRGTALSRAWAISCVPHDAVPQDVHEMMSSRVHSCG